MRKRWLLILACATLLAFIYSARSVFITLSQGRTIDWLRLIVLEFQYWYVWAALTPVILWFARRFELQRTNWRRTLLVLIAFGLFIAPFQAAVIETMDEKRVFDDGVHKVELYRFANPHAAEMIIAYLPKEKILIQADMFDIPEVGGATAGDDTADLANQIEKLGLQVETLIPVHGRLGTMADLRAAVAARLSKK